MVQKKLVGLRELKGLYHNLEKVELKYNEKIHGERTLLCIDLDNLIGSLKREFQSSQQRLVKRNHVNVISMIQFREYVESYLELLIQTGFSLIFFSDGIESNEKANSTKNDRFKNHAQEYSSFSNRIWNGGCSDSKNQTFPSFILSHEEVYSVIYQLMKEGNKVEWRICKKEGDLELNEYVFTNSKKVFGILSNDNDFFFSNVGNDCYFISTQEMGMNGSKLNPFTPFNIKFTCQMLGFKNNSLLVILYLLLQTEFGAMESKKLSHYVDCVNSIVKSIGEKEEQWYTMAENVDVIVKSISKFLCYMNEFKLSVCRGLYIACQPKIISELNLDWGLGHINHIFDKFIDRKHLITSTIFRASSVTINIDHFELVDWRNSSNQYIMNITAPIRKNIYSMFCWKPFTERIASFEQNNITVKEIITPLTKVPYSLLETYEKELYHGDINGDLNRLKSFYSMCNVQWPTIIFGSGGNNEINHSSATTNYPLNQISLWHHFVIVSWLVILENKEWKIVDEDEFDCFLLHSLFLYYGLGKTILAGSPQNPSSQYQYFKGIINNYNCDQYQVYVFFNVMLLNCYHLSALLNLSPNQLRPAPSQFYDGDLYQFLFKSIPVNIYNNNNQTHHHHHHHHNKNSYNNPIQIDNRLWERYNSLINSHQQLKNDFIIIKSIIKPSLPLQ